MPSSLGAPYRSGAAASLSPATANAAGTLSAADFQKLAAMAHGAGRRWVDIETGTYNSFVTTSSLGGLKSRKWDGDNDGSGRFDFLPPEGRTGGNVIVRAWVAISATSAGKKLAWKWSGNAVAIGDTLGTALGNIQTNYQDVGALTAKVVAAFDITVLAAAWSQSGIMGMVLERLASSDAQDNYTAATGDVHLHAIELIPTAYGIIAAPTAPV